MTEISQTLPGAKHPSELVVGGFQPPDQNIHYVMAIIKVPMLRQLNGSFDSLSDHTTISFEMIDDLPTKPEYKVDNNYIKLKLNEMFAEPPIALRKPSFTPSHIIKNDVVLDDVDTGLEEPVREPVGFMECNVVTPSAAGGCKVEDPTGPLTRSQVDVTELCQRIPFGNSRLAPKVPDSVKSTCDELEPEPEPEQEPEIDNSEEIAASKIRRFSENFLSQHKKKHFKKLKTRPPSPDFKIKS